MFQREHALPRYLVTFSSNSVPPSYSLSARGHSHDSARSSVSIDSARTEL